MEIKADVACGVSLGRLGLKKWSSPRQVPSLSETHAHTTLFVFAPLHPDGAGRRTTKHAKKEPCDHMLSRFRGGHRAKESDRQTKEKGRFTTVNMAQYRQGQHVTNRKTW